MGKEKREKEQLQERLDKAHGNLRKQKQHESGKLTAWERIMLLLDEGSFIEANVYLEHRCTYFGMEKRKQEGDGVISGIGKIQGRTVCVYAQDFTVFGGSIGKMNAKKIADIQEKALKMQVPIIGLFDSGGARVQEGIQGLSGHGNIFYNNVQSSGIIPQISAIMGNCAGGASYSPALTDFILMVEGISNMFITGPKVVKEAIGQVVSMEELGGTQIHSAISGMADLVADSEKSCIEMIKKLLSYLPDNYLSPPPLETKFFYKKERQKQIEEIIPLSSRTTFDTKEVIYCLIDEGSYLEIKEKHAPNMITMLARIGGHPIGIIANQSKEKAGCIDIDAADKAASFIRICDSFNLPLLNLVDVSGFYPGKEQEQRGIIRHGAKMLFAYSEATVLKITVVLRKAYGGSYLAMCSKELGADMVYAWPKAEIAVMSAPAAVDVLYADRSPQEKELYMEEYKEQLMTPFEAAHNGYVDEVILPSQTRDKLINILSLYENRKMHPGKIPHKNIPL